MNVLRSLVAKPLTLSLLLALAGCSSQPSPVEPVTSDANPTAAPDPTATEATAPTATAPTATVVPSATATASSPPTRPQMVANADVARGKELFEGNHCGACHGSAAKPSKKFPNVYAGAWDDARIDKAFGLIKKGKSPMPSFGDKLEDKDIAELVSFMKGGGK